MRDTRAIDTQFAPGLGRRPIPARSAPWARRLAHALAGLGVHPNAISLAGLGFALLGAWALGAAVTPGVAGRALGSLAAAVAIPLRLLMNLLDGMVAEERGGPSRAGELFNEVPDRIADAVLLIAAGWASLAPVGRALGWIAALDSRRSHSSQKGAYGHRATIHAPDPRDSATEVGPWAEPPGGGGEPGARQRYRRHHGAAGPGGRT